MSGQTRICRCTCGQHWNLQYANGTAGLEFATQRVGLDTIMLAVALGLVSLHENQELRKQVLDQVPENTDSVTEQKVALFNNAVRRGEIDREQIAGCALTVHAAA